MTADGLSRRNALSGAALAGLGAPLLAACGGEDPVTGTDPGSATSPGGSSAPAGPLTSTSEVEVGGGTIFAEEKVVVTQPTEGEFRAFSTTCTHQGCPVTSVSDGTINCPCHGSQFSIEDGSVAGGPAPGPLSTVEINVEGDEITLA